MKQLLCALLLFLFYGSTTNVQAQTMPSDYGAPATPVNVANAPVIFKIKINGTLMPCAGPSALGITLPPGYIYTAGSAVISGGSGSVSQTSAGGNAAVLSVSNIPAAPDSTVISYTAAATCAAIGGTSSTITYTLAGCTGNLTATTAVNVQNAQLNIVSVTNPSYTGLPGDVYSRAITIRNDGYGAVDTFYIDSKNGPGVEIISFAPTANVTMTKILSGTDTIYRYRIVKADRLLTSATFTITEQVRIKCNAGSLQGVIKTWYGPSGTECLPISNTYTVGASIDQSHHATITVTAVGDVSGPLCRGTVARDTFRIANTGNAPAFLPRFFITTSLTNAFDFTNGATPAAPVLAGSQLMGIDISTMRYKIGAAGTWTNLVADSSLNNPTVTAPGMPASSCFGANDKLAAFVHFPALQPGDEIYISFQEKSCGYTDCQPDYHPSLNIGIQYTDECGNIIAGVGGQRGATATDLIATSVDAPTDVFVGDVFSLSYNLNGTLGSLANGAAGAKIRLTVTLPAQFQWTGNASDVILFDGRFATITGVTISYSPGTNVIILEFAPQSFYDFATSPGYLQLNNVFVRTGAAPGDVMVQSATGLKRNAPCTDYYSLNCNSTAITVHDNSGCGLTGGLLTVNIAARRVNYGSPDMNNDNLGDGSGSVDMSKVRTRYVMTGDTLEIIYKGKIKVSSAPAAPVFKYGAVVNTFTQQLATDKLRPLYSVTNLYDNAGAAVGTETAAVTASALSYTSSFNISTLNENVPARTTFLDGDSIVVKEYFKVVANGANNNDNADFLQRIEFTNNFYVAEQPAGTQYSCGNFRSQFNMVSFRTAVTMDRAAAPGCSTGYMYVHVNAIVGNVRPFFFEYRKTMAVDTAYVTLPAGIHFQQAGTNATPLNPSASLLTFPLTQPDQYLQGESWEKTLQVAFTADCDAVTPSTVSGTIKFKTLPEFKDTTALFGNVIDVYKPVFSISSPRVIQTINSNSISVNWELQVNNAAGAPVDAANFWLAKDNGVTGFVIDSIQTLTGPGGTSTGTLTPVNGIYQAGILSAQTSKYFSVFAHTSKCSDSLSIVYGYNCTAYPSTVAAAVCTDNFKLYMVSQVPALQLNIITQPLSAVSLCEELPYEIEVLNSGLGTANNLVVKMSLPASGGLEYVPGSYGIKYPASAGSYTALPDANVTISGGYMFFAVPAANIASFTGTEKYRLQFRLKTTSCNFTSGQRLNFIPSGSNGCKTDIDGTVATTGRILITGAPTALPSFIITSSADSVTACGTGPVSAAYRFKIVNTGSFPTSAADGFRIVLPAPWTLNTAVTYTHNPSGAFYSANPAGGIYDFKAAGLAIGDSIVFNTTIHAANASALACGNTATPVMESGFAQFSVTCISTGAACTTSQLVDVENTSTFIFVKRPSYSITSLSAAAAADPVSGTANTNVAGQFTVVNANNTFVAQNAVLNLYKDVNQNGIYDAGDLFINSGSFPLSAGTSQTFSYNFIKPAGMAGDICPLIAVLSLDCNCSPATFSLSCNIVLPVKLESFTATGKDCKAVLSWKTTSEINFSRFDVEYSNNGTTFTNAGTVKGSNNINGSTYKFTYVQPDVKGYYRLKMIDLDGRFDYSKVIPVNTDCNERIIAVSPNPAQGLVTVTGLKTGDYLQVYSMEGKLLLKKKITTTQIQLDLSSYSAGVYTISVIKTDGETIATKVIRTN